MRTALCISSSKSRSRSRRPKNPVKTFWQLLGARHLGRSAASRGGKLTGAKLNAATWASPLLNACIRVADGHRLSGVSGRVIYTLPMARRPTKLQVYDHAVVCPYCRTDVLFPSLMEKIIVARRNCPHCRREMLIEDGRGVKMPADGTKKPAKHTKSRRTSD